MLTLTSQDLVSMAGHRAMHTVAHLAGVAGMTAGGAALIDRMAKTRKGKLQLAAVATAGGLGVSMMGHIASDRVVETVGDGIMGAGLLTFAFHLTPKLFRRDVNVSTP